MKLYDRYVYKYVQFVGDAAFISGVLAALPNPDLTKLQYAEVDKDKFYKDELRDIDWKQWKDQE